MRTDPEHMHVHTLKAGTAPDLRRLIGVLGVDGPGSEAGWLAYAHRNFSEAASHFLLTCNQRLGSRVTPVEVASVLTRAAPQKKLQRRVAIMPIRLNYLVSEDQGKFI